MGVSLRKISLPACEFFVDKTKFIRVLKNGKKTCGKAVKNGIFIHRLFSYFELDKYKSTKFIHRLWGVIHRFWGFYAQQGAGRRLSRDPVHCFFGGVKDMIEGFKALSQVAVIQVQLAAERLPVFV